jgi:hypothetical protein
MGTGNEVPVLRYRRWKERSSTSFPEPVRLRTPRPIQQKELGNGPTNSSARSHRAAPGADDEKGRARAIAARDPSKPWIRDVRRAGRSVRKRQLGQTRVYDRSHSRIPNLKRVEKAERT